MEKVQKLSFDDIMGMEKIPRLTFVNALSGFKSANLIGTVSKDGVQNLAVFSSVVHVGSNPPLLGMITRPMVVERDTYANIKETGYYTINHIQEEMSYRAHQTSANYDSNISEFEKCNLEPEFINSFTAPYVKESQLKIGMSFLEEYPIKANGTIMVIGKIEEVILPEGTIEEDGYLNLEKLNGICIGGLDSYYKVERVGRYVYARVAK